MDFPWNALEIQVKQIEKNIMIWFASAAYANKVSSHRRMAAKEYFDGFHAESTRKLHPRSKMLQYLRLEVLLPGRIFGFCRSCNRCTPPEGSKALTCYTLPPRQIRLPTPTTPPYLLDPKSELAGEDPLVHEGIVPIPGLNTPLHHLAQPGPGDIREKTSASRRAGKRTTAPSSARQG